MTETEKLLQELGLTYRLESIRVDAIDVDESMRVQARRVRFDEDTVIRYAEALERGDTFPPIVVCNVPPRNRVVCPAGIHRIKAHQLVGRTEIAAYYVETSTAAQRDRIAIEDNLFHGLPTHIDERLWLAERLITQTGTTQAAAASRFRIPESRINTFMRQRSTEDRLHRLGLPPIASADARERLAAVRSDVTLRAIVQLPDLRASFIATLVPEINRAKSEADQLAVVAAADARLRAEDRSRASMPVARGKGNATPYARLTRLVNGSLGWPRPEEAARDIAPELQPVIRKRLLESLVRLESIIEALQP